MSIKKTHHVSVQFDCMVRGCTAKEAKVLLRQWFGDREYFRLVVEFELLSVTILNQQHVGEYFEIEARVDWNIRGLVDDEFMGGIFKTICSTTCGPTDTVLVNAWDIPIMEERQCSP